MSAESPFSVEMVVYRNSQRANAIILYSHTLGSFTDREDTDRYLRIFCETISQVRKAFPEHDLFYIQNYEGFDPTSQIDYIRDQSGVPPVSDALEIIPFSTMQRRVCKHSPEVIRERMPDVHFCPSIPGAIEELGLPCNLGR